VTEPLTAKLPFPTPAAPGEAVGSDERLSVEDQARLAEMLRLHHAAVWRTAYRMGLNAAQADDVTQQAYIAASRRMPDIRVGSERGFLLGAVVLAAKNHRRLAAHRYESSDTDGLDNTPDRAPSPDQLVALKQARAMLDRVLDRLPESTREVFVLFELEGLPLKEIRELLDIPMGTLASRLRRAREQFEREVEALRNCGGVR